MKDLIDNFSDFISEKEGIKSIKVSLENKEAHVVYDPGALKPSDISEMISDMGFDTYIKSSAGDTLIR